MGQVRCLVLHPYVKSHQDWREDREYKLQEAQSLVSALSAVEVSRASFVPLANIVPSTYIGKGKLEEFTDFIESESIELVVFNVSLTPIQQRNLEKFLKAKVIDRTALILEIFAERAQTKEGKLQVDLAMQEYQKSRLVRSWTHLERQRGGAGFMGGPGERQIESDRRQIAKRIDQIKVSLEKVVKRRQLHRKARKKVPYPIVSLVGYTNAGKSTLFNLLTQSNVLVKDQLFATLDPTMRLLELPSKSKVILSDTVGFISDLPTELVAAFRATLEEVIEADILLHVQDLSSEQIQDHARDVQAILVDLIDEQKLSDIVLNVYNKVDLAPISPDDSSMAVSAITGEGIDKLLIAIDNHLMRNDKKVTLVINIADGQKLSWLYEHARVISRAEDQENVFVTCCISQKHLGQFKRMG